MFGPSPCPGHYAGRLATMASADFCLINHRIAPGAALRNRLVAILFFAPDRRQQTARIGLDNPGVRPGLTKRSASHVKQISPDKNMNCRSTTASFTVSAEPRALLSCASLPADSALYDVSVRRLTALLQASFPQSLAALQLSFASNCCTLT